MKTIIGYELSQPMPLMRRFDLTLYNWYNENLGGVLPSRYAYQRDQMNTLELWILEEDITLTIIFSDGSMDDLDYKKGFVWDLASVPEIGRSIVDNDSFIAFVPAFLHDAAFGLHLYDFETCNDYFGQLIVLTAKQYSDRYKDMKELIHRNIDNDRDKAKYWKKVEKWTEDFLSDAERKSKIYTFGVNTSIGERIYKSMNPSTHWNNGLVGLNATKKKN